MKKHAPHMPPPKRASANKAGLRASASPCTTGFMKAEPNETRVTLRLALDPHHWRAHDRAGWAMDLAAIADKAAPSFLRVEGYELGDTLISIRMFSGESANRLRKRLKEDASIVRLRTRLADLGARPEFEIEERR